MRFPVRLLALLISVAAGAPATADPGASCAGLASNIIAGAQIREAHEVPADPATGLPAYCEVTARLEPVAGSRIGIVARLPDEWNGKMLGLGGGGWAGSITLARATPGIRLRYATIQTDAGHESTGLADTAWQVNPEALIDFAWRAIHLASQTGKSLIAHYYGRETRRAYFFGCSTGGRQGMLEAQRFPGDYDGIIAGAPVYTLVTQTSMWLHNQAFIAPDAALDEQKLAWLNAQILARCDAQDGLADGMITDPRRCAFNLDGLRCAGIAPGTTDCLSNAQVAALNRVYGTVRDTRGRVVAYPLMRGSETGWPRFVATQPIPSDAAPTLGNTGGGLTLLRAVLFGDPFFALPHFDPDRDLARIRRSTFARLYEAIDPNLSAFLGRGGKLLMWHGIDDPGPSPWATVDYYEAARKSGKNTGFEASVRLYLAPGVQHCGGGAGADDFDLLSALDDWVSSGTPPGGLIASNRTRNITRPLCAWPALPHYRAGDPANAASFECAVPGGLTTRKARE